MVEDIRRCREVLLDTPLRGLANDADDFATGAVRDPLCHVDEHRLALPQIGEFMAAEHLRFIGFALGAPAMQTQAARFPNDPPVTDLVRWNLLVRERPATYAGMDQ